MSTCNEGICVPVPNFSNSQIQKLTEEKFSLGKSTTRQLHGWVDKNYLVSCTSSPHILCEDEQAFKKNNFVLKILNSKESRERSYIVHKLSLFLWNVRRFSNAQMRRKNQKELTSGCHFDCTSCRFGETLMYWRWHFCQSDRSALKRIGDLQVYRWNGLFLETTPGSFLALGIPACDIYTFCCLTDAVNYSMLHLHSEGIVCSVPILSSSGSYNVLWDGKSGKSSDNGGVYLVRLFPFLDGPVLTGLNLTSSVLFQVGAFIASIDVKLQVCATHSGFLSRKKSLWNLESVPRLKEFLASLAAKVDPTLLSVVRGVLKDFNDKVLPLHDDFQKGLIHSDCNPSNLIYLGERTCDVTQPLMFGVIDFGDMGLSCYIFELAIAMSHFILDILKSTNPSDVSNVIQIREGYRSIIPLNQSELTALRTCVVARVIQVYMLTVWYDINHPKSTTSPKSYDHMEYFILNFHNLYRE